MNKQSIKKQIIKNSFWNIFANCIAKAGSLIFMIIVARMLLPEKYGAYNLVISIAFIFLVFTDLGIGQTMMKYVSLELDRNKKKAASYFRFLLKIASFVIIIASLILLFSSGFIANSVFKNPDLFYPLLLSSLFLLLLSSVQFVDSIFFSLREAQYVSFRETITQILKVLGVLLIPILFIQKNYTLGVIAVFSFALFTALIFSFIIIKRRYSFILEKSEINIDKKEVLRFMSYLALSSMAIAFLGYFDSVIIGLFIKDTSYIGFYKSASNIVFSFSGLFLFLKAFIPAFTRLKREKISISLNKIYKFLMIIAIPSAFGISILGKYIIRILYGYEYLVAAIPFSILSFAIISEISSGIFSSLLIAKGKSKTYAKILIFATVINIALGIILLNLFLLRSNTFAIVGLSIANLISSYFLFFAVYFKSQKYFKVRLNKIYFIKPLFSAIVMSIVLYLITSRIKDMGLLLGGALVLISIIIYFVVLILIKGLTKQDILDLNVSSIKQKFISKFSSLGK